MKKLLLNLGALLLAANCMIAQQVKQGSFITENSPNAIAHSHSTKKQNKLAASPTTTTSTCASLNYPAPTTWTLQSYSYAAGNGYVNGTNIYGDLEKASYFDASASTFTLLNQVYVQFAVGKGTNLNKVVSMIIYDGTTGSPGAAIGTSSMTLGDIKSDIAGGYYSSFVFSGGVPLPASKKFFTSIDMSALTWDATTKDSLSIVSNKNGQSVPPPTWERASDNNWYQYNTAGATTASVSLVMFPFLTNIASSATFSVSANPTCVNQSITYNATGTAYDASNTSNLLLWTFSESVGTTTLQSNITPSKTYTAAGTYTTVLEVLGGGCSVYEYAIKTVTVNALPNVTASPTSTTICNGTSITLNGGGASTYTWTGGVSNGVSFAPSSTLNYTVSGTNATTGCTNSAVTSVSVNPLPTVSANTTASVICPGSNVTLTGGGATSYVWTGGVTDGVAFNPTSTDTYTVTGSTGSCSNTAVVTVSVGSSIVVVANASSSSICAGSNVTLTGSGASTYTWTGGVNDGVAFAPSATDTYTVVGASGSCTNSAVVTVTVNSLPTVSANSSASVVCNGSNVTLTGSGASSYSWTGGVSDGVAFAPSATNTYTVTGTVGTCSNSAVVSVTVNNLPTVVANTTTTTVCSGNSVTLSGSGAVSYVWTNGVSNGVSFTPTATNVYSVTGTDANGCSSTATVQVVVSTCTGIEESSIANSLLVFPNPSNGELTIQSQKADVVNIINDLGQTVKIIELNQQNNFSYKVSSLNTGIYFLVGKTFKQKIVVTK